MMTENAKDYSLKILCVHPNFELYGSDRSFAMAVEAIADGRPDVAIEILLPQPGPILALPPFDRLKPTFREMWILRRRGLLRRMTLGMPKNIRALIDAHRSMAAADIVYVNTIIGIDFILMARFSKTPVIIHVREIPNGLEMSVFRRLLLWSKARLVFNSNATRDAFRLPSGVESAVVYNGLSDPGETPPPQPSGRRMEVLVIGRLNHWKGQETVVDAVALLPTEERERLFVRIVGGTFNNQNDFHERLDARITEAGLAGCIRIDPFEDDPTESFRRADVVVVPSRLPEPFGRVAIEAMAHSRPVVCSGHGGLVEIVEDGVTGRLFAPSDPEGLARALRELLATPNKAEVWGEAGRRRFLGKFTNTASNTALLTALLPATTQEHVK